MVEAKVWDVGVSSMSLEEPGGPGMGAGVKAGGLGVALGGTGCPPPT